MLEQPPIWFILIAFVLALGPLIFFHELGHYSVARMFGIGAETFSIGLGKKIAGWTDKRGTSWQVGWLPLGGYVKLAGDMDPTSRPDPEDGDPTHFQNKPLWQRALVVLAGPIANFILAILIFAAFFMAFGQLNSETVITEVVDDTPAAEMGLQPGDVIVSINDDAIPSFEHLRRYAVIRPGADVTIDYLREGEERTVEGKFAVRMQEDEFGQEARIGFLGVTAEQTVEQLGPIEAIGAGADATWQTITMILEALRQIVVGERSVKELGGPMKIAQVSGQQASLGFYEFVSLLAFLSINLGFINLLPVPMLDGGHLAFYAYEAIRRKPASARVQEWGYRVGLSLIAALIIFTTFNDLSSFGVGERLQRLIG
ncbi:RIP metalloprotease RseP [Sphingomicrobium clamense]|uniref:Zinc metalloprotease n=1 Tax=Sphingomicrobium clamense TaxID=2851013 RepID=A0ABS6V6I1_9SPHN|nr:RIP metalloprotease RseP [Sphingomicrobium sp. B8]MBW0145187.1 RIP metalloprotease RseP [Sphingomicrobium sp. B8]